MRGKKNTEKDFWLLVDKTDSCWNWLGRLDKDGYGWWWFDDKNVRAHKHSMKLHGKEIKLPLISRHLCNNPKCVNPDHIVAGTQKENIKDQLDAGTFAKLKYDKELIDEIKLAYSKRGVSTRALSALYGVSKSQIHLYVKS
jgi:hypothetical protein